MKLFLISLLLWLLNSNPVINNQPDEIGQGEQPQLAVDPGGILRLIYGNDDKIYYASSADNGTTFSKPTVIAEVKEMHLGMTRGPQLASSKDYSIVTAMDKKGNIHSFQLNHKTKKWTKQGNVNDMEASAPEGLMSVTADEQNNFYAVWLDLREDRNNKIAFSSLGKNGSWSRNKIIYKSPDKTVCECCKPSIAVKGKQVSIMFRNWINGSRDLHLVTSLNAGQKFNEAIKLGIGTWKLKGCPMDGGGILLDKNNVIHTVWQREGVVYYDQPGQPEIRIADGRGCNLFGKNIPFLTWQEGGQIYGQPFNGNKINIGEGSAVSVIQLKNNILIAAWEKDEQIVFRKL